MLWREADIRIILVVRRSERSAKEEKRFFHQKKITSNYWTLIESSSPLLWSVGAVCLGAPIVRENSKGDKPEHRWSVINEAIKLCLWEKSESIAAKGRKSSITGGPLGEKICRKSLENLRVPAINYLIHRRRPILECNRWRKMSGAPRKGSNMFLRH